MKYKNPRSWAFGRLALPVLMLSAIFLWGGLQLKPAAMAGEPLVLNYRTISAVEQPTLPGVTVFKLEIEVRNMGTVAYNNVSVNAISLMDATKNFGSVAVGNLPPGISQTVIGEFKVPNINVENMIFKINHS